MKIRITRPRRARVVVGVLLAGLLLAACTADVADTEAPEDEVGTDGDVDFGTDEDAEAGDGDTDDPSATGSSLVIAENEPPQTFDPIQALNSTVDQVVIPAYDTLVDFTGDNELIGVLADDWEVSDDGTEIAIQLRDDVLFHDGAPLTASDVAYTLDRIAELGVGVAAELSAYGSAEVVDDHEVVIRLSSPDAPFLAALSRVYILNSALVEENRGDDFGQSWLGNNTAGSGPYELVTYSTGQQATFAQFADYWGGWNGQAEQVVFRYLPEPSTQRDALQIGEVDLAMSIATSDIPTFQDDPEFTVDMAETLVQLYAFFNMQNGPTADPRVREAVTLVYDYQSHVEDILAGAGSVPQGPLPSVMACHADLPESSQDLERAQELFEEAGVTELEMAYLSVIEEHDRAGTLLQSLLRDVGVDLNLRTVTFPEFVDITSDPTTIPDLGMIYAFPAYPDPNAVLNTNFHSRNAGPGFNYGWYMNDEVDELVDQGQTETDQDVRCEAYERAQEIIAGDFASMNIANPQHVAVMRAGVQGFEYVPAHHQTINVYGITVSD